MESGSGESTWATALPVILLPSVSFQLGPAKWLPMTLPLSSFNSASGALSVQENLPSVVAWQV